MEQEVRISNIADLSEMAREKADIISFGHEGCIKKLPPIEEVYRLAEIEKIKIVLPKLREAEFNYIEEYLQNISKRAVYPVEVTVNDFGALYYFSRKKEVKVVAGRLLTKGFEAHPQAEFICKRYPDSWKQNVMQTCMMDHDKITLLKKYNVDAIEIDVLSYSERAIENLRNSLEVQGICGTPLLAVFSDCPCKKAGKTKTEHCQEICTKQLKVDYNDGATVKSGVNTTDLSGFLDGNVFMRKIEGIVSDKLSRNIFIS